MKQRPNIILMAIGHSGTTIVTKMLWELGWNRNDADDQFAESVSFRETNRTLTLSDKFDHNMARDCLAKQKEPWVLKDPRFIRTQQYWMRYITTSDQDGMLDCPFLLYLTRDLDRVKLSYQRQHKHEPGREHSHGLTVDQLHFESYKIFDLWPADRKFHIDYDELKSVCSHVRSADPVSRGLACRLYARLFPVEPAVTPEQVAAAINLFEFSH